MPIRIQKTHISETMITTWNKPTGKDSGIQSVGNIPFILRRRRHPFVIFSNEIGVSLSGGWQLSKEYFEMQWPRWEMAINHNRQHRSNAVPSSESTLLFSFPAARTYIPPPCTLAPSFVLLSPYCYCWSAAVSAVCVYVHFPRLCTLHSRFPSLDAYSTILLYTISKWGEFSFVIWELWSEEEEEKGWDEIDTTYHFYYSFVCTHETNNERKKEKKGHFTVC